MFKTPTRALLVAGVAFALAAGATSAVLAQGGDTVQASHRSALAHLDQQEIIEPLHRWALGFDEEDEAMMRDAFTDDAVFVFHLSTGGDPFVFEGIEAVMGLFLGAIDDQEPEEQRRHVTTNALVQRIDRRSAIVTSYLTLFTSLSRTERPTLLSTGVYTDTVVLEPDGVWRIQRRELRLDTPS